MEVAKEKEKEKTYICRAQPASAEGGTQEIKILPRGMVRSQKGDFLVDDKSFELMLKEFKERKIDKVVDYEHQTLQDVQAPAAGWIKNLKLTEEAVVAEVEWNPKAEEYLKNKEYRYLSPVVRVRPSDKRAVLLHSVALTNTPAIDGMFSINKLLEEYEEENKMNLKELAKILGLPEDADEEAVKEMVETLTSSIKELKEAEKTVPGAAPVVCKLLGISEDAKPEEVSAAITELKVNSVENVSKAEYLELKAKLDKQDSEQLVAMALKDGKITADMKDWAMEYALKDSEGFKGFLEKAPQVVPMEQLITGRDKKKDIFADSTFAVCKNLGLSKEDLEKYGKDEE